MLKWIIVYKNIKKFSFLFVLNLDIAPEADGNLIRYN